MSIWSLPLIVAIVGGLVYALPIPWTKATELGRLSFVVGLLAFLLGKH